jgi:outer membrane biosynthesis protein TonB
LEELEAQYAADAKKKKKKKKKPAPEKKAPPKKEEKPKPKVKTKKDTIENLKKYLDKEEDREKKIDYDNIIRPTEPIRNFQDIARKTAALAKLDNNNDDEEGARRRGQCVSVSDSLTDVVSYSYRVACMHLKKVKKFFPNESKWSELS